MAALGLLAYLFKLVLCGAAFMSGVAVSGGVLPRFGVKAPAMPEGADAKKVGVYTAAGSVFVALVLAQLAAGIAGSMLERWLAILAWGVNTVLEASIFTVYQQGSEGAPFTVLYSVTASLAVALTVAWLFPSPAAGAGFWAAASTFCRGVAGPGAVARWAARHPSPRLGAIHPNRLDTGLGRLLAPLVAALNGTNLTMQILERTERYA